MAIAFRAVGAMVEGSSNPHSVALPAGHTLNDLIILMCVQQRNSGTGMTFTATGYTERSRNFKTAGVDMTCSILYKVHDGSETDPIGVSSNFSSTDWGCASIAYSGVDTSTPWDVANVDDDNAGTAAQTWLMNDITTVTANAMALSFAMTNDNNILDHSSANGHTIRAAGASYSTSVDVTYCLGFSEKLIVSAGAAGMPTWNQSANNDDQWIGTAFALRPAAAAAGAGLPILETAYGGGML